MSSLEVPLQEKYFFKKKVCLLGGLEKYKNEFQKILSSNSLPIENKQNIGVNISKIDFSFKKREKFEFLLWNIDCRRERAYLRTIFYNGAEAVIILISESKIEQILHYFNEIQANFSSLTLIFCIILEKLNKEEIFNKCFSNRDFKSLIRSNHIQINEIEQPSDILNQISSIFIKRHKNKELDNFHIIDLIQLDRLFVHSEILDECNDYYEPQTRDTNINQTINTEQLVSYILNLKLDVYFESSNWIKVKNENLGTFSIFLKNGNVYYYPKVCEKCKESKCVRRKRAPFFICIESGESNGWTNINGFNQNELLILTKILALKDGNEINLPKSILRQIKNLNTCEIIRK
ncbi:MAG: hypothetical protein ACFE9I_08320 [Candidatus Hermodarchaeota archaeon]